MNVRELTLQLLDDYEISGKYVNLSLSSHAVRALPERERAQLTALLYTTVEHKLTYDYYIASLAGREISKIDVHTKNILRLGICQLLHIDSVPDFAAVSETVKLGRHKGERSFVNGLLRSLIRCRDEGTLPMPKREKNVARYLSVAYSFPLQTVKRFIDLLGEEECEALLASFGADRGFDITVNTLKISRDEMLRLLEEQGIAACPSLHSSISIRISRSYDPRILPGFDLGYFFVQDEACAVSAEVLDPAGASSIIDVCSAPGGKAFSAAILSSDRASILALDIHESKLSLIESGAERLGLGSVRARVRDATDPDESLFGSFDRVICDVPCSGLGVLGKKPDLRYKDSAAIAELPALQYRILESSARYLAPGGVLVYSTCTLLPEENESIVQGFLREHSEFSAVEFSAGDLHSACGMLTTYPHKDSMDGFFIAKLIRKRT